MPAYAGILMFAAAAFRRPPLRAERGVIGQLLAARSNLVQTQAGACSFWPIIDTVQSWGIKRASRPSAMPSKGS